MQDRPHVLVARFVLHTANDHDGSAAAALAEDHPGRRGHQVDQGLFLPFGPAARLSVFRGPERGNTGGYPARGLWSLYER